MARVFTQDEISYAYKKKDPFLSLSVRFAAKEAFIKALSHDQHIPLIDIEVRNQDNGRPVLKLHGKTGEFFRQKEIQAIHLSLSHEKDYGVASVVIEGLQMKVVTAEQMRTIDRVTIEKYGIPGTVLMERAGLSVAEKVRSSFDKKKVIVLAGGGNNGGDGIAAARNLHNWGWHVRVLLMLRKDKLSPDCLSQYRMAKHSGVAIEFRKEVTGKRPSWLPCHRCAFRHRH